MATASTLNDRVDLALAAIDAGEWATALRELRACKLILATRPEMFRGEAGQKWNSTAIDDLIRQAQGEVNKAAQASLIASNSTGMPIVEAPIEYVRG